MSSGVKRPRGTTLHKVFREFHCHFKFLQPHEFDFRRKSKFGMGKIVFFRLNKISTKAAKALKTGINILTRRVLGGKIFHNLRLNIQCRRSAISQALELKSIFDKND